MQTLREQFTNALIARGEKQVPSRSGKYLTFTRREGGFWFVGQSGALRYGKAASVSFAASDAFKAKLLAEPKDNAARQLAEIGL